MRVENGALVIRDGFTHYPQEQATYRYFRGDLELPPRIILLDGSGTLSFDVLSWLGEQGVALARVKWNGEVAVVASGGGYAADATKVDWQRQTRADDARRFAFAADIIWKKLVAGCILPPGGPCRLPGLAASASPCPMIGGNSARGCHWSVPGRIAITAPRIPSMPC